MTKARWTMSIPVISTRHMPSTDALELLGGDTAAVWNHGGFAMIDGTGWTAPILSWLATPSFDPDNDTPWVRFDCDADVIPELPVYDWN